MTSGTAASTMPIQLQTGPKKKKWLTAKPAKSAVSPAPNKQPDRPGKKLLFRKRP